jgi:ABC-type amino acid transport substrate-binding protein
VTIGSRYDQLYRLVAKGRVDFAIDTGINSLAELHRLGLEDQVEMIGVVARYDLHNILHSDNKALQPKIGATITAMQKSGELAQLIAKYERKIIAEWKTP